ncbi:MAG: YkgJ family cysteine cluster protein [Dehalococcoidia bacterium]
MAAYELLLPGHASFICQPDVCDAHCCRRFSVSLGQPESDRMVAATGLAPSRFLETENGQPILLPLVQPFLLSRTDNHCTLLSPERDCTVYEGRPNACRIYPHQVVFVNHETSRPLTPAQSVARESVRAVTLGRLPRPVPLLLRHVECPGFTGPPLESESWLELLISTLDLQLEFTGDIASPR